MAVDYLVDVSGSLSHVVAESDAAGNVAAYYVRGDDLLSVARPTGTRFYHADGLGSIRALTDESGTITDSYGYTAFGELIQHVGTDPQPYLFAGEPYDPTWASLTTEPGGWIRGQGDSAPRIRIRARTKSR